MRSFILKREGMTRRRRRRRRRRGFSPQSVQNRTVRVETDHAVLDRDAVNKRLLVVEEVGVGHPELVGHPVVQREVEGDPGVGQPLVPPILLEVHGQRVVLGERERERVGMWLDLRSPHHHIFGPQGPFSISKTIRLVLISS